MIFVQFVDLSFELAHHFLSVLFSLCFPLAVSFFILRNFPHRLITEAFGRLPVTTPDSVWLHCLLQNHRQTGVG